MKTAKGLHIMPLGNIQVFFLSMNSIPNAKILNFMRRYSFSHLGVSNIMSAIDIIGIFFVGVYSQNKYHAFKNMHMLQWNSWLSAATADS